MMKNIEINIPTPSPPASTISPYLPTMSVRMSGNNQKKEVLVGVCTCGLVCL